VRRLVLAALAALTTLVTGCAQVPTERIVLLPGPDGRSSGAVLVQRKGGAEGADLLLATAYAQADVARDGRLLPSTSDAATVQRDYAALMALQPARPRSFVVNFSSNSNTLTPDTVPVLASAGAALVGLKAGELIVIGHTDRVGTVEANDRLSLQRAEQVRDLLIAAGVPATAIQVSGRGEREPLVQTADEVAEARNRRVEIKLR